MSEFVSVEQVLEASDLLEKEVDVAEWGGKVKVRGFSKAVQKQLRREATVNGELDAEKLEMLMFVHGVVEPTFSESHHAGLLEKSAGAIDRVLKAILEVSGLDLDAVKRAETTFRD